MSETDLARSWWGAPLGGEEASENDGRGAPETELSARDLSCSDQLKPCWSARELALSEGALEGMVLLAWATAEDGTAALARRPTAESAEPIAEPWFCEALRPRDDGGEAGLLPFPGLLPPGRYPLMAEAPKLMRRTNGVFGAVLAAPGMSSSSIAFSSIESELVDMLPRRMLNDGGLVGDVPERPMVVTDNRRL